MKISQIKRNYLFHQHHLDQKEATTKSHLIKSIRDVQSYDYMIGDLIGSGYFDTFRD